MSGSAQNWCDLFFILDILAANTDPAAVLVFLGRKDSHVPDLADKEVILEGLGLTQMYLGGPGSFHYKHSDKPDDRGVQGWWDY